MPLESVVAGTTPPRAQRIDIRELRQSLSMSQPEFASKFGFNLCTLRQWEQNRKQPDQAARVLLLVIKHNPEIVLQAIKGAPTGGALVC